MRRSLAVVCTKKRKGSLAWQKHKKTGVRKVRPTGTAFETEIVFILTRVNRERQINSNKPCL